MQIYPKYGSAALLVLAAVSFCLSACTRIQPANPEPPAAESLIVLKAVVEDVADATAYRYQASDSAGHNMDTAKIIADPEGGYLAVYHTYNSDEDYFEVHLAASSDLINWKYLQSYGRSTHQPSLMATSDGGFLLANETDNGSFNWIQLRYYASRADLLSNQAARVFNAPHTQVPEGKWAEGTPNIISISLNPDIDHSTVEIGFHYYKMGIVDRQARGLLKDFNTWTTEKRTSIDKAIEALGVKGNIGDRDQITFDNREYTIIEGQFKRGDWGSWRVFLWDNLNETVTQFNIQTHGGSQSFANPGISLLPAPDGGQAVVVTLFLPGENAAVGEAGELIYYRKLLE